MFEPDLFLLLVRSFNHANIHNVIRGNAVAIFSGKPRFTRITWTWGLEANE
jgi:hypothetical protein